MSNSLKDLLEKSTQLVDPKHLQLHKNLESIHEQTKKFVQKVSRTTDATKGDYLLAGKGFDVEKYRRSLSKIDLKTAFEPLEPLAETDIDGYLKHEHNMIILTAIEEAKKMTSNEFYKTFERYMDADWQSAKKEFIQKLELYKDAFRGETPLEKIGISKYKPQPSPSYGLTQTPYTPGKRGKTSMDNRMIEYAAVVYYLNQYRKKGDFFPVISKFIESAKVIDDRESRKREIIECFTVLDSILDEKEVSKRGIAYHEEYKERSSALMRKFCRGAKKYLENQYERHIQEVVAQNTKQAQIDVQPNNRLQLIRAYLNIIFKSDAIKWPAILEVAADYPVWAMIFYCLRCGFIAEALQIAERPESSSLVPQSIIIALKALAQGNIPETENQLLQEYRKPTKDPFKQAVYLVVGRCDVKKTVPEAFRKVEDFLWLKLSIIRENSNYTLQDLQKLITSYGPKHFNPRGTNSLLYFRLLLLTIQFEQAIEYLCGRDIDGYQVEAVHFAIALNYYGCLHLPSSNVAPLLSEENGKKCFNFNFLIKNYVRLFAHTDVQEAVSYLYLIEDKKTCFEYIKELVIESKDSTTLLGAIEKDGRRRKGYLEEFLSRSEIISILQLAASEYESTGRYATAIDMYFMLEEFGRLEKDMKSSDYLLKILQIINRELSQVLIDGDNRQEVINTALKVNRKFSLEKLTLKFDNPMDLKQFETFTLLLQLTQFFDLYLDSKFLEALQFIERLDLIPFDQKTIESMVHKFHKELDKTVKRKYADIMFATMSCLYNLYKIKKSKGETAQLLQSIRSKANALLTFAGFIQNQLSSDMYSRLIRMDVLMR